ncbi:unnamed protein product, partial [Didymodactylos carnosus]
YFDSETKIETKNNIIPNLVNGTLECTLGADGYYEDPFYCNIYHHCLAGVDYVVHCPNQLAWNEKKKMCDWATNVNCTGKTLPVVQGKTTFCTNRQDGRYASDTYCNAFHHCIGGTDHIVRCTGELQWDDNKKECGWESIVKCGAPKKMLPNENKFNSTSCTGKTDGSYPHEEFCNVYHVCESGSDNMRQCPHQLFWDNEQQKCEWSNNVRCTGRTLVALSMETSLFCIEKSDGFYIDAVHCNIYHQCMADIDVKLRCPERLVFNETLKRCDWPETTRCKGGNILLNGEDTGGFCTDKPNGEYPHDHFCNRYFICQNGKDIPDGNYPDVRYCNIFHQCQAAMDYPKRCPNRLMFNEQTKECDWEDKVDCNGREKLIDTEGLEDEARPGANDTRGRSTKFCMLKQNGNFADSYYCNVYHNCHGGFDCNEQGVGVTMECSRKNDYLLSYLSFHDSWFLFLAGLVFNEKKKECDYQSDANGDHGTQCVTPRSFLRAKPKAEQGTVLFEGADATGQFPTRFDCSNKDQQNMFADFDWCNIYHVCIGNRDNIFLCPPGTLFNDTKQGCFDRLNGKNCNGTNSYYKPSIKRHKRTRSSTMDMPSMDEGNEKHPMISDLNIKSKEEIYRIPSEWRPFGLYPSQRELSSNERYKSTIDNSNKQDLMEINRKNEWLKQYHHRKNRMSDDDNNLFLTEENYSPQHQQVSRSSSNHSEHDR